ncbi:DUF6932 family protein [Burkholderia glumae]
MIPPFDQRGLLPPGKHLASWSEVFAYFSRDARRCFLVDNARNFALNDLAPKFSAGPLYLAGSTFSDKPYPNDIEVTMPLGVHQMSPTSMVDAVNFRINHDAIKARYEVDFYLYLDVQGAPDFSEFFQYVGDKTAAIKHLQSKDKRGIIEVSQWIHG